MGIMVYSLNVMQDFVHQPYESKAGTKLNYSLISCYKELKQDHKPRPNPNPKAQTPEQQDPEPYILSLSSNQ